MDETGAGGFFRIDDLLDRPHVLAAQSGSRYAIRGGVLPGDDKILLQLQDPGYVSVAVRDPQGRPVEGIEVTVNSIDGAPAAVFIHELTDEEGVAEMNVPPGTIGLVVAGEIEPGLRAVVGETTVSVRERESVSTVLSIRKRPRMD